MMAANSSQEDVVEVNDDSDVQVDGEDEEDEAMETAEDNNNFELTMPQRKQKEPSAVWKVADRVEGGARCKLCHKFYKCA